MRTTTNRTNQFKKDYKRERRGRHGSILGDLLRDVLGLLLNGEPLPPRYRDHPLTGDWKDFRDCHLRPDLVLIYRLTDDAVDLVRLGSHSELSL